MSEKEAYGVCMSASRRPGDGCFAKIRVRVRISAMIQQKPYHGCVSPVRGCHDGVAWIGVRRVGIDAHPQQNVNGTGIAGRCR